MNDTMNRYYAEMNAEENRRRKESRDQFEANGHLKRLKELEEKYADLFEYQKLKAHWERIQDVK